MMRLDKDEIHQEVNDLVNHFTIRGHLTNIYWNKMRDDLRSYIKLAYKQKKERIPSLDL